MRLAPALLAAGFWAATAATALASEPRVAFESTRDGNFELYLTDEAGSEPARLTRGAAVDAFPSWSPDGGRVAFASDRTDANSDIWSMLDDGSNPVRLTDDPAIDTFPAWSPDGSRIAFASGRGGESEIWVMEGSGADERRLTSAPGVDTQPAWSPDGRRIAFVSYRSSHSDLYLMDSDGGNLERLTEDEAVESWPAWSPDGESIAIGAGGIVLLRADGSGRRVLVDHGDHPSFSPDGASITFESQGAIWRVALDGSGLRRIFDPPAGIDAHPAFGPAEVEPPAPRLRGPFGHVGRWITDAEGRVVLAHGVNVMPLYPNMDAIEFGFGEDDLRFLRRNGLGLVRLGLAWEYVEPAPGVYDEAYLDRIRRVVDLLGRSGIPVLLESHQGMYARRYSGGGFPDWAAQDDGLPAQPDVGWPYNYFVMPAQNRAWDHFWANDRGPSGLGLQDSFAAAWRHVATRFRDAPSLIGYDIVNEPWPGSVWPTCANPLGCPVFDSVRLTTFTRRVVREIRRADPTSLVWYEPAPVFNAGADSSHGSAGDGRAGFAFHVYCEFGEFRTSTDCDTTAGLTFANAERQAGETGDALLIGEFSRVHNPADAGNVVRRAEQGMVPWIYWSYWDTGWADGVYDERIQAGWNVIGDPSRPPAEGNAHPAVLDDIVRPHPVAVAGTPERVAYDAGSRRFDVEWTTARVGGGSLATSVTEIVLPRRVYPNGYLASTSGGKVLSAPDAGLLRLRASPGSAHVSVRVTPRSP
jgi:endoglycosylceramidase